MSTVTHPLLAIQATMTVQAAAVLAGFILLASAGSMAKKRTKPYGTWPSPLDPATVAATGKGGLADLRLDGDFLYVAEARPAEQGRTTLLRLPTQEGPTVELLPSGFSCRSRVHEYGGGAFAVIEEHLYFCNQEDQRIYHLVPERQPQALTPEAPHTRYGDLTPGPPGSRLLLAVREVHDHGNASRVTNDMVAIEVETGAVHVLDSGHDFFTAGSPSPDGSEHAWIVWDHPSMPWDKTLLKLGRLRLDPPRLEGVAVVEQGASIAEPRWSPSGELHFVSDRSGWWQIYRRGQAAPLCELEAEFTAPLWNLGGQSYGFADSGALFAVAARGGRRRGVLIAKQGGVSGATDPTGSYDFADVDSVCARNDTAYFIASRPDTSPAIFRWPEHGRLETLRPGPPLPLAIDEVSRPQDLAFPCADGRGGHAFYYGPRSAQWVGPVNARPPAIVRIHGGPTACASPAFRAAIQFWTTRGFAVLDVNYRGSTTFGSDYRNALKGRWALADIEDCIAAAAAATEAGLADPARLLISGGSAGGLTVLAALTFHNVFAAGACYYGIGDLELLANDTHKFEARYLDSLVGPYPETAAEYRRRSPLHAPQPPRHPIIFFHGLQDRVVPPEQTERFVEAMRAGGVRADYLSFPNEGHGFRDARTVTRCLEAELAFYHDVLQLGG